MNYRYRQEALILGRGELKRESIVEKEVTNDTQVTTNHLITVRQSICIVGYGTSSVDRRVINKHVTAQSHGLGPAVRSHPGDAADGV